MPTQRRHRTGSAAAGARARYRLEDPPAGKAVDRAASDVRRYAAVGQPAHDVMGGTHHREPLLAPGGRRACNRVKRGDAPPAEGTPYSQLRALLSRYLDEDDATRSCAGSAGRHRPGEAVVTLLVKRLTIDICHSHANVCPPADGRSRRRSDSSTTAAERCQRIALARKQRAEGVDPRRCRDRAITAERRTPASEPISASVRPCCKLEAEKTRRNKPTPARRPCGRCGALFTPRTNDPRIRFCSERCSWRAKIARRPKAEAQPVDCAHCGKRFVPTRTMQRYCDQQLQAGALDRSASAKPKPERVSMFRGRSCIDRRSFTPATSSRSAARPAVVASFPRMRTTDTARRRAPARRGPSRCSTRSSPSIGCSSVSAARRSKTLGAGWMMRCGSVAQSASIEGR